MREAWKRSKSRQEVRGPIMPISPNIALVSESSVLRRSSGWVRLSRPPPVIAILLDKRTQYPSIRNVLRKNIAHDSHTRSVLGRDELRPVRRTLLLKLVCRKTRRALVPYRRKPRRVDPGQLRQGLFDSYVPYTCPDRLIWRVIRPAWLQLACELSTNQEFLDTVSSQAHNAPTPSGKRTE